MRRALLIAVALALLALPGQATAQQRSIAVVVHPDNPVDSLSLGDLRQIFRLDREYWPDGKKIRLLMQEKGTFEKRVALDTIYAMTEDQLREFWVRKIASMQSSDFPRALSSSAALKLVVGKYNSAIGFVDASQIDDSVKVVRIDGRLPGDPNYALAGSR